MTDRDRTLTEGEGKTLDMPEGLGAFGTGQILGDRYQIRSQLGRGGMGEVWRAFDLKLRVEVALKALLPDLVKDERRIDLLRREVRAAREVVSPNVCRIFDLIEIEDRELVSMEYVDGATLLGVLQERGPLQLNEAQDIASQFLAGLEAIHRVGLVHRDVKPENIMLTRAGRVVVMDFGLAWHQADGEASASGTPAYMAPEHAAGEAVDARADVYSAGVVLAEMVSPEGIKSSESRKSLWEGVRSEPTQVPDSPWAPVIKRAVARDREQRQNSAHTLIRELEDVTLRVEGADESNPYPGLASFTESDAEYFYGREAEVEAMWRTLEQPHLLAIIGPSGSGKSSFIEAGLIPARPEGWSCVVATPGSSPLMELAQALVPEFAGDADAIRDLIRTDDAEAMVSAVTRWRERHDQVLLVVDQFEELFTLNPPDVQSLYSEILGRLALKHDVHVLISMRDDFLFHCQAHEPLRPVFSELTPLGPLVGGALRRALVQPASRCGYRFEDDDLVAEMLAEVEGERGTLPLLAFAVHRLWEERDSSDGLLTREAYQRIGGVGGALGLHAEETLERIGEEHTPMVREIFRNLVTAQGTRAVRDLDQLLSIFDEAEQKTATDVLHALVDARLLTTFETGTTDKEPRRRIEIIHESLLGNWPRLVRWQTQDQEGAQLRDELRQSARAWNDHGRHDDRLWAGTAFREYQLWRERYPGGLTESEEAFAAAMTSFANRRRRRRRFAATAVVLAFAAIALAFAGLWRRSVKETHRAEAANLLSLGQLELDSYPSATVAHAIASLELTDEPSARRLALEALWKGPTAMIVTEDFAWEGASHPDGQSLVQGRFLFSKSSEGHLSIIKADGSSASLSREHQGTPRVTISWMSDVGEFITLGQEADSSIRTVYWSMDEKRPLAQTRFEASDGLFQIRVDSVRRRALFLTREDGVVSVVALGADGETRRLGALEFAGKQDESGRWSTVATLERTSGRWIGVSTETDVYVIDIGDHKLGPARHIGRHKGAVVAIRCDPLGRFVATAHAEGEIRLWDTNGSAPPTILRELQGIRSVYFTPNGTLMRSRAQDEEGSNQILVWELSELPPRFLRSFELGKLAGSSLDELSRRVVRWGADLEVRVWSMGRPFDAEPLVLSRGEVQQVNSAGFLPRSDWLVTADATGLSLWPFSKEYPVVLRGHELYVSGLAFAPDGSWLASASVDNAIRLWPLEGEPPPPGRILGPGGMEVAVSPDGRRLLVGSTGSGASFVFANETPPVKLDGLSGQVWGVAFSPDGRWAAGAGGQHDPAERIIQIWDVESGEELKVLEVGEEPMVFNLQFTPEAHLLSASASGLLRWNVETGERELIYEGNPIFFAGSADGRRVVLVEKNDPAALDGKVIQLEVDSGHLTPLDTFGSDVSAIALDPTGTFTVTGDKDGEVRVGLVDGSEPHLLIGHENTVWAVAIDPKGRWIASGDNDGVIRIWPMPDLTKPPLHTLPREDLIAKLKTLTNLRVVRDEESATGWKLTHDPFPGWETVPTW